MFEVQQGKKLEKKLHKIKNKLITDRKKIYEWSSCKMFVLFGFQNEEKIKNFDMDMLVILCDHE